MMRLDVVQAVSVGKNVALRPGKSEEDLTGRRFATWPVNDLDLAFLNEIVVLHHSIHAFDAVADIDQTRLVRGVKRHAMVLSVDGEIGHLANAVRDGGAQN